MSIFYFDKFPADIQRQNFGDDINPLFLSNLFDKRILESSDICLVGIGTLINDNNAARIHHYPQKVVFSSGVGYGPLTFAFDESWDFACVRGPLSAAALRLPPEKGICDGAILLADIYPHLLQVPKRGRVLIPHVKTTLYSDRLLRLICARAGFKYLSPSVEFEEFLKVVATAELVVTESMHGAIVADALRTPWLPSKIRFHEQFKWHDWFESIELPYDVHELSPLLWDGTENWTHKLKRPYTELKLITFQRRLVRLTTKKHGFLSDPRLLNARKAALWDKVLYINERYS